MCLRSALRRMSQIEQAALAHRGDRSGARGVGVSALISESIGSSNGGPISEKEPSTDGTWIGLTLADALIWVIAELQIGTAAFVLGRCAGQARPTGRVDAVS